MNWVISCTWQNTQTHYKVVQNTHWKHENKSKKHGTHEWRQLKHQCFDVTLHHCHDLNVNVNGWDFHAHPHRHPIPIPSPITRPILVPIVIPTASHADPFCPGNSMTLCMHASQDMSKKKCTRKFIRSTQASRKWISCGYRSRKNVVLDTNLDKWKIVDRTSKKTWVL